MAKVFEDVFMEIQADMISLGLDYVESQAEKVFIYVSYEESALTFNVFYQIKGKIVTISKVNEVLGNKKNFNKKEVFSILNAGIKELDRIISACKEYDRPIPTEMRLTYDVKANSLKSDYQYEPVYSNTDDKHSSDIFMEWIDAERNKNK
ncbi:Uncharacterised protein [Listeria grayi]|uniref:DUF600 domain-containing protein n=1 Tax=Listeria grayi FSL F6-1183 TaxID=1265827 RepID=A0A829R9G3_LISGR|nr:hypothetical protein [Listeria grayi]EUJ29308.1 hypothetical protein LMUR_04258 [Listeria grayi FSL F6-1183]VEI32442.1 Uncharacterised protein [Listeria grayi]